MGPEVIEFADAGGNLRRIMVMGRADDFLNRDGAPIVTLRLGGDDVHLTAAAAWGVAGKLARALNGAARAATAQAGARCNDLAL